MILQRSFPTGLRLLVRAHEEVVPEEAEEVLAKVVVGVQCCLGEGRAVRAACCDGLEVRRCGNDQRGCDMADLKMDSFRRTKMIQLNHHDMSHKHVFTFVRACEQTVCTSCTLWYCVPAIRNLTIQHALTEKLFLKTLIHCSSFCEECHHHDFHCQVESCQDEDDEDEVCGTSPCCSVHHLHPVFRSTT